MPINFNYHNGESPESKMRSPDRILNIEVIDGKKARTSSGLIDPSLFKDNGDKERNRLHVVMDLQTSLWSMHYEKGNVPPALQGRYTGFKQAKEHADRYFENRNIRITEVLD